MALPNNPTQSDVVKAIKDLESQPSGAATDVQINSTSITSGGVANIVTKSAYDASSNKIATEDDLPTKTSNLQNDSNFAVTNADNSWEATQTPASAETYSLGSTAKPFLSIYSKEFYAKNTSYAYSEAPSANSWLSRFRVVDKDGTTFGGVNGGILTSGNAVEMGVNDKDGAWKNVRIVANGAAGASHSYALQPGSNADIDLGTTSSGWKNIYLTHSSAEWEGLRITNDHYTRGNTPSGTTYLGTWRNADKNGNWLTAISGNVNTSGQTYWTIEARQATSAGGSTFNTCSIQVRAGKTNSAGDRYIQCTGNVFPVATETYNLGLTNYKWNNVHSKAFYENGLKMSLGGMCLTLISNLTTASTIAQSGMNYDGTHQYLIMPATTSIFCFTSASGSTPEVKVSYPLVVMPNNSTSIEVYGLAGANTTVTSIRRLSNCYIYEITRS